MNTLPDSDMISPGPTQETGDFWQQPAAERTLRQAAAQNRLARAYLFVGPDGVGKWAAAHWIARTLYCESEAERPCGQCSGCLRVRSYKHPDWRTLFAVPTKTADKDREAYLAAKASDPFAVIRFEKRPFITIGRVRALIVELGKTSIEGGPKVTLIAGAEQIKAEVQEILLKTIEEPPPNAYFILTSADPGRLLPTVVSRCQMIRFLPVAPSLISKRLAEDNGVDAERARLTADLCGGGWGNAVRFASDDIAEWTDQATAIWQTAFNKSTGDLLSQIDRTFRPNRRTVGHERALLAFDLWSLLLRRELARVSGIAEPEAGSPAGSPVSGPDTAWACWKILQNGRRTLYVNVAPHTAVTGTFLELRRRLRCH